MIDTSEVEKRAELTRVSAIQIGTTIGGLKIGSPADLEIIAHRLARGKMAVPPHVRDNPGVAFALCLQALEWKMPIMSVINKSYVVNNRGVERMAYESQLIHAVIERNAPLKSRMRYEILGEGDDRRCKVWATFKGEKTPHEYTSETLAKLREARGRNPDKGDVLKGSPLWESQPEVQLFYSASRTWARMFAPDVILGAYTPEDPQYVADNMVDITPKLDGLAQRLKDAKREHGDRGFDPDQVARTIIEGEARQENENEDDDNARREHADGDRARPMGGADRPSGDKDQEAIAGAVEASEVDRKDAPRRRNKKEPEQGEIFPQAKPEHRQTKKSK